jgi:hypothetical protein
MMKAKDELEAPKRARTSAVRNSNSGSVLLHYALH